MCISLQMKTLEKNRNFTNTIFNKIKNGSIFYRHEIIIKYVCPFCAIYKHYKHYKHRYKMCDFFIRFSSIKYNKMFISKKKNGLL